MRNKRIGFTSIEVLLLIVISLVLLCLLLAALRAVQEKSRLTQCKNNLKTIGLALQIYHDNHTHFPPGLNAWLTWSEDATQPAYVAQNATCDAPEQSNTNAFTSILPYMDHQVLYNTYNINLACCARENNSAVATVVQVYLCPSNPRGQKPIPWNYYLPPRAGWTGPAGPAPLDYALSAGGSQLLTPVSPFDMQIADGKTFTGYPAPNRPAAGAFNINSSVSIQNIKDGTSDTILVGEMAGGPQLPVGLTNGSVDSYVAMTAATKAFYSDQAWSQAYIPRHDSAGQFIGGTSSIFAVTAANVWYQAEKYDMGPPDHWVPRPLNEAKLTFGRPTVYDHSIPNGLVTMGNTTFRIDPTTLPPSDSISGFRSYHTGRAQFVLGDGSVYSINENVDARLFVGVSTLLGRERLDDLHCY